MTAEGFNIGMSLGSGEVVVLVSLHVWKRRRRWSIARSCCLLLTDGVWCIAAVSMWSKLIMQSVGVRPG